MKNFLRFLLMLLAFLPFAMQAQNTVDIEVGTGTSTSYTGGFCTYYNYTWQECIYLAQNIQTVGGYINTISWYSATTNTLSTTDLRIYMGTTSRTTHSSTSDWQPQSELTLVYSSTSDVIGGVVGWKTFTLNTPFYYNGVENLVVVVAKKSSSTSSSTTHRYTSTTNAVLSKTSNTDQNSANYPGTNTGTLSAYLANIKLNITEVMPTCPIPRTLEVVSTTTSDATVSWSPQGSTSVFDLYLTTNTSDVPNDNTTPTVPSVTDTFYTFPSLSPNTTYKVCVRANCSSEYSPWRSVTFTTPCAALTTLPFTDNMDSHTATTSTSVSVSNLPNCWSNYNNGTNSSYTGYPIVYSSSTYAHSGTNVLRFYSGSGTYGDEMAILPPIDETIYPMNTLQLSFYARALNTSYPFRLVVGVLGSASNINTFTPIDTLNITSTTHELYEVPFLNYTGTGNAIGIMATKTTTGMNYGYVDDIMVDLAPDCFKPTQVTVGNITTSEVTLNWQPGDQESAWEVTVVPHGQNVSTGTPEQVTSLPHTVYNLLDDTQYDVYVRALCVSGGYSNWTTPVTFRTDPYCTSPRNVTVSQIVGTSALVSWQSALVGAIDYTVEYTVAGQNSWSSLIVNGTSVMLSGLTQQTNYQVRVFSNCQMGDADTVNKTFTTGCLSGGNYAVGNGTSTTYELPINNYWEYSYTQQIFLASEMSGPADISSVSFQYAYSSPSTVKNSVNIYLGHTTQSTFASTSNYIPSSGLTLVYTGPLNCQQGWNTFNFTTPFHYNGTDNLVLVIDDNSGSYDGSSYIFNAHDAGANRSVHYYQDGADITMASPTSADNYDVTNLRSNVKFGMPCDSVSTCIAPNVYISDVTDESITIGWAPGNNESSWTLEYMAGNGAWVSEGTVTTPPYILTNLAANTNYTVRMQSDCGGGTVSSWSMATAKTKCSTISIPYSENFDNTTGSGSGYMVPCWTRNTNYTSTAYPYTSSSYHHSGNYAVYFYGTSTYYSYIASPRFDDQVQMNNLQIRFWAYKTSAAYQIEVGIMSDPDDFSTFESLGQFSPSATSTWQKFEVNTNLYLGSGRHIAFRMPTNITSYMYLDDVEVYEIPACDHVVNIHTVGTVAQTSVDLAWTPRGTEIQWNVVYGLQGTITDPSTETPTVVYTPTVSLTNLLASTTYDVYVQSDCGSDVSSWEHATFTTACGLIDQLPFAENFEGFTGGSSSNNVLPLCWRRLNTGSTAAGCPTVYSSSSYASSGSNCLYFYSTTASTSADQYAILPQLDVTTLPINTLRLSFKARRYSTTATYVNTIIVGVMTNANSASTFVPVDTVVLTSTTIGSHHVDFTSYTGTGSYIAIKVPKPTGSFTYNYNYIDDVTLDVIPACATPTNLQVSGVTTNGANVSWTAGGSETEWELVLVQGNAPASTGTVYNEYTNSETLTNLLPGMDYTLYLRAVCPQGGYSEYVMKSFTTPCEDLQTLPFTCNFDNVTGATSTAVSVNNLPVCWGHHCGTYNSYAGYPIVYNSSSYAASGTNAMRFYTYTGTTDYGDQYAILPPIDVNLYPLNTLQMTMDVRKNSTSYANFTLIVGVMTDPNNVSTFVPLETIVETETNYSTYTVYFGNYTGTGKYIAMYAPRIGQNGITYNTGYVDNIVVDLIPACPPVTDFSVSNVTGTSALLTWTEGVANTATGGYVVEYSEYNQNNWITESGITSTTHFLTGLNQLTHYDVRVKADCGSSESTWKTADFTTGCLSGGDLLIGNGTSTTYELPINNYWEYSYTQQIFLASEMHGSTTISSVSFQYSYSSPSTVKNSVNIYLGHTTQSTFSSASDYIPSTNLTMVYSGPLNCQQGWNTFNFTTPFQYNGTDNLVLVIDDNSGNYNSSDYTFYAHDAGANRSVHFYQDGADISMSSPTSADDYDVTSRRSNVKFGTPCDNTVTCIAPNLAISAVDQNSITLVWAPGYSESSWNLEYKASSDLTWTSVPGVTGNTYTITGLNAASHYDIRMRSDCGGGDLSSWTTIDAYTQCGDISIPFTENFDGYSGATSTAVSVNNLPYCWNHICGSYSSYAGYPIIYSSSSYAASGTNALRFYTYTGTTDYGDQYAILPAIDVNTYPLNGLQLTMDVRKNSTSYNEFTLIVGVMSDPTSVYTFIPVDTVVVTSTTYAEKIVYFNNYMGTGTHIALMAPRQTSSTYNTGYVDNIEVNVIPTCPKPNSLTATAATTNSITLSWNDPSNNASTWNIEYGPVGFTQGTGTTVVATSNPYTITGLTGNTGYTFYVQSDCGGGDLSTFSSGYTTWTACEAISQLPYTENFDAYAGSTTTSVSVNNLPNCWGYINHGTSTSYSGYPIIYNSSSTAASGTNSMRFYTYITSGTYDDQMAVLPEIDLTMYPMNTLQVSFAARALSTSYPFTLVVGVLTNPTNASTFVPVDTITMTTTTFNNYEVMFNHYTGTGAYIGIVAKRPTSGYNYGYVDNVTIELIPTCPKPTNLTASNPTSTSLNLSWVENGSASNWVVEYGPVGFTPGTSAGTTVNVTGTPSTTITGLNTSSSYDFYVKADCGGGDESPWSMKTTGSTLCDAITQLPYTQNFDANPWTSLPGSGATALMPNCWERINTYSSPRPFCYDYGTNNYNGTPMLYFYATSGNYNIAIMPEISSSIPVNTLKVSFMYRGFSASYTTPMSVGVMTDPTNVNTYVEVATVPFDATVTNWVSREVSFANYTGTGRFIAFRNGSSSATTYAMMDNLVLDYDSTQMGGCTFPTSVTASNVTQTSATITWTAGGTETAWELQYKTASGSWSNSITVTGTPSYNLTGLTAGTQYQVRVRAVCSATETSNWSATATFTTQQPSVTPPTVTTNDATVITTNSAVLNGVVTAGSETITAQGFEWKATVGGSYAAVNATGTTISYTLQGLTPGTGYTFRAFANTASGTTYGAEKTFTTTTEQPTCPSPTNVTASNITETTADISWTQPGNTATSWDVLYKESAASSWYTVTTSNNPYTLVALNSGSSYDVQIIAHCTNGQTSDPSATYTFMTVGIDNYTLDNSVTVYPNPTTGVVQIKNEEWRMENVEVYDAYGKLLQTMSVFDHTVNIDLSSYAKGTYFVRVTTERGVVTKRVVKN